MSKIKTATTALTALLLVSGIGLSYAQSTEPVDDGATAAKPAMTDPAEPADTKTLPPLPTPAQPSDTSAKPAQDSPLMTEAPAAGQSGAPADKADRN